MPAGRTRQRRLADAVFVNAFGFDLYFEREQRCEASRVDAVFNKAVLCAISSRAANVSQNGWKRPEVSSTLLQAELSYSAPKGLPSTSRPTRELPMRLLT